MASIIVTYLRTERRKWGLTQKELAFLIGIKSRTQISMLELGMAIPTGEQLLAFQYLFGMTARQLFPQLAGRTEHTVLRNVKAMKKSTEADSTLRAQRKNTLLRLILSRAV